MSHSSLINLRYTYDCHRTLLLIQYILTTVTELSCPACLTPSYTDPRGFITLVGHYTVNTAFLDTHLSKITVITGYKYLRNLFNVYVIFYLKKYGDKYTLPILKI